MNLPPRWLLAAVIAVVLVIAAVAAVALPAVLAPPVRVPPGLRAAATGGDDARAEPAIVEQPCTDLLPDSTWDTLQEGPINVRFSGYWWVPADGRYQIHAPEVDRMTVAIGRLERRRNDEFGSRERLAPTFDLSRGQHAVTFRVWLPTPADRACVRFSRADRPPVPFAPGSLLRREMPEERLAAHLRWARYRAYGRHALRWLAGAALVATAALAAPWIRRRVDPVAWPRALAVLAAGSYLVLLQRWFNDPGIAGTLDLRANPVWPWAATLVAAAALSLWAKRDHVGQLLREARLAAAPSRADLLWLLVALVVFVAVHIPLLVNATGVLDSDAAIPGLAAKHIHDGRVAPAFYYGSLKTGTLTSHLVAALYWLTWPSPFGYVLVTRLFLLAAMIALYALLRLGFPPSVAGSSVLWLAITPVWLLNNSLYSEYPEMLLFTTVGMLLTVALRTGALRDRAWWGLAGLAFGLGIWSHPLIVPLAAAAGLVAVLPWRRRLSGWDAALLLLGLTIGAAPAIVGLGAELPGFLVWLTDAGEGERAVIAGALTSLRGVAGSTLPMLFSGQEHDPQLGAAASALYALAFMALLGWGAMAAGRAVRSDTPPTGAPVVAGLLSAAAAFHVLLFALSPFGQLTFLPRYLVPLYFIVPGLAAIWLHGLTSRLGTRTAAAITAGAMIAWAGLGLPASRAWLRDKNIEAAALRASIAPLLEAGVRYCEAPYWDAYRLTFASNERIVCDSTELRRIQMYRRQVEQNTPPGMAPYVAMPDRDGLLSTREFYADRDVSYRELVTPFFVALLPRSETVR